MPVGHSPTRAGNSVQQNPIAAEPQPAISEQQQTATVPSAVIDPELAVINARQLRLPPFCKNNPRLWFAQVELAFQNHGITVDASKFRYVAVQITGEALDSVSDIILAPPTEEKYEALKRRIVTSFDEGDEKRLRRLLQGHAIGDDKPTAYLHRLKNLSAGNCSEPVLRSLFLEQLPDQVRAILAASGITDLHRLAEMADKAIEVTKPTIAAVDTSDSNQHTTISVSRFQKCKKQFNR